jgi:hypothetical protein
MRTRVLRAVVTLTLLGAGAWAVVELTRFARYAALPDATATRVDRMHARLAELGLAQTGYLGPSEDPTVWFDRFTMLVADMSAATGEIGASLRSTEGTAALRTLADQTASLAQSDVAARDSLLTGDAYTASRIIFGESRAAIVTMQNALATLRTAEAATLERERAAALERAGTLLGGVGLMWVVGVLVLAATGLPSRRTTMTPAVNVSPAAPSGRAPSIDLEAAAGLCMEMARVETSDGIATLLGRAAGVIDAEQLTLWVGAGDDLLPVMKHGTSSRPGAAGPVRRSADHPAARAWRRAVLQTVAADGGSNGEILAPLIGPGGCNGVLAVELRSGRETEPLSRALVVMIAAQLSSVVGGKADDAAATGAAQSTGT